MNNEILNKYVLGNAFEYFPKIDDHSVDLFFTGIPDFEELGDKNIAKYETFIFATLQHVDRIVKRDGFVVFCQTDRKMDGGIYAKHVEIIRIMKENHFNLKDYKILVKDRTDKVNLYRLNYSHILVFTKEGKIPLSKKKGDYLKDLWVYTMPENKNFWPEEFCDLVVSTFTLPTDLVVDPFCGRGTVLKSAKKLGRYYFGAEIKEELYNPTYVNS